MSGRVPFGRMVLFLELIAALTFVGYTMVKKDVRLPFSSEPYLVDVILPDAQGLNPDKEPAAGVAGVAAGKVVDVQIEHGRARVTLRLDSGLRGKVFNDATAVVRPTSALQTLIVNVLPGDPSTGALEAGKAIEPENTDGFVHIDKLTGVLDADTQAQVQVLVSEAATALQGREPEVRKILDQLGTLTEVATPVAEALADRRRLLSRLTVHLDQLFATLGRRGQQLGRAIDTGSRTLAVTAAREVEVGATTRQLSPLLGEVRRSLAASRSLAQPLTPALEQLTPAARDLEPTATELGELSPHLDRLVGVADRLVSDGRRPVRQLAGGLEGLAGRIRSDQIPALRELVDLTELLFKYRNGLAQFGDSYSGAASTNRRAGTYAQQAIVSAELDPSGFGLGPAAARSRGGKPSRLSRMLAEALEHVCRQSNTAACLLRFNTPGLPAAGKG